MVFCNLQSLKDLFFLPMGTQGTTYNLKERLDNYNYLYQKN